MKNPLLLREASHYFKMHVWKTIVIKAWWEVVDSNHFDNFLLDVSILAWLNMKIILVFWAWKQITNALTTKKIPFEILDWIRQTSKKAAIEINKVNKTLSDTITKKLDKLWVKCKYLPEALKSKRLWNNFTAEIESVNSKLINKYIKQDWIIIVWASIKTKSWVFTNVNADNVAISIAEKIKPHKFIFLTSVDWVMNENRELKKVLTKKEIKHMIKDWVIYWWMKVKTETCLKALNFSDRVHMISWLKDWKILFELFTKEWVWTMIINSNEELKWDFDEIPHS